MVERFGYTTRKYLSKGSRSRLWLATRDSDGVDVVIKRYVKDRLQDGTSHCKREFEALRRVQAPGVVRAFDLLEDGEATSLVLELLPGVTLAGCVARDPLSVREVLQFGTQLASALGEVHRKRWIHRDLSPSNIQVDPATSTAHLFDFGSARMLGSAQSEAPSRSVSEPYHLGGGLAYASPEQTGRMGRGVDSRSDLYSLGACLYFALSGRPPFEHRDPLALLHAHMARIPDPIHSVEERVPVAVSRIIAKLLEKEPNDRYQSAHALAEDLRSCLDFLDSNGSIPEALELGSADTPLRPTFGRSVHGRDSELKRLRENLEAILRAEAPKTLLIHGPAGIGKSALINALRPLVGEAGGFVAHGKCESLLSDVAHVALKAALAGLADQLLCAGEKYVKRWQSRLLASLGALSPVVTSFVPGLSDILGELEPPSPLGPRESAQRLELAIERFLRTFPDAGHPLMLSLDDLQWANRDSITLLEALICSTRDLRIAWILVHRSDDSESVQRLRRGIRERNPGAQFIEIEVGPLSREGVQAVISDALGMGPASVGALVNAAARKTDCSPLLVQEFLIHLHDTGRIAAIPGTGWTWSDDDIASAEIQEGAVSLLCANLDRLQPEARELVATLSCVGDPFCTSQLELVVDLAREDLEQHLFELVDEGLIVPSSEGFRFAHDRIREACLEPLSSEKRARTHYSLGRRLLAQTSFEQLPERCAEISIHFQLGTDCIGAEERGAAQAVHLAAGQRALASGGFQAASRHLAAGRSLLNESDWDSDATRTFSLLHDSIEAEFLSGELECARELANGLVRRPLEGFDRCRALAKRVRVLAAAPDEHFVHELLSILESYGVRWVQDPSPLWIRLQIYWLDWTLRGPLDETCFGNPKGADLSWVFPSIILQEAAPALLALNSRLLALSILAAVRNFHIHGAIRSPALLLAGYAAMRIEILGHWDGVRRYAEAALAWAQKSDDPINVVAQASLYSFCWVWLRPRGECVELLQAVVRRLGESGDIPYSIIALTGSLGMAAMAGRPIPELLSQIDGKHRWEAWPGIRAYVRCYGTAFRVLAGDDAVEIDLDRLTGELESDVREIYLHGRIPWLLALCMFERFDLAGPLLELPSMGVQIRGSIGLPEFYLLRGLHAAWTASRTRGREARRARRRARRAAAWLRARANHAPDCVPLSAFMEAELACHSRSAAPTLRSYAHAARLAGQAGLLHHEAWIHERVGRFLIQLRRTGQAIPELRKASDLYARWGAQAKVDHISRLVQDVKGDARQPVEAAHSVLRG